MGGAESSIVFKILQKNTTVNQVFAISYKDAERKQL
jgi:hypothetical protein